MYQVRPALTSQNQVDYEITTMLYTKQKQAHSGYLIPDDSTWLRQLAICFNNSGRCEDVVYSQVVTSH